MCLQINQARNANNILRNMNENICRFCMNLAHQNIFARNILDKITSCMDLKLYPGDGLPDYICKTCEKIIEEFYVFKEKCVEVAVILRSPKFSNESNTCEDLVDIQEFVNTDFLGKYDYKTPEANEDNQNTIHSPLEIIENIKSEDAQETPTVNAPKIKLLSSIQCEICGGIFKTLSTLKQHMGCHAAEKPYTCQICDKRFTRKFHVEVHMRSHSGEKPFICNTCGRSSGRKQDLIRHMRIHSDERNYACLKCDRRFKRSWDAQIHMRTHTGAKPYSCDNCLKSYATYSSFQKHLRSNSHIS